MRAGRSCCHALGLLAALATAFGATGCVVLPGFGVLAEGPVRLETQARLQPGTSTRADVLMLLGDPEVRHPDDCGWEYRWKEHVAHVLVGGTYSGASLPVDRTRVLVLAFDGTGRLARFTVIGGVMPKSRDQRVTDWFAGEGGGCGPAQ